MTPAKPPQPALNGLAFFIDQALPQTQCTRCGYPDCAHYAQAVADGQADINQCPPGGAEGVQRLAALTGQAAQPLNPRFGVEGPLTVARIDEDWCIGCTLCIKACPVDAILGANKFMHTVMSEHCTGCELCIPACPVDCIELDVVNAQRSGWQAWSAAQAQSARQRYALRQERLASQRPTVSAVASSAAAAAAAATSASTSSLAPSASSTTSATADERKAAIAAALAKARAQRQARQR